MRFGPQGRFRYWTPIPQTLLLQDVVDQSLVALSDDDALVIRVSQLIIRGSEHSDNPLMTHVEPHWVSIKYWRPRNAWASADLIYQEPTTIQQMLGDRLRAHTVMVIPGV